MQRDDEPRRPCGLSAKDLSMLNIAIAASLDRRDDLQRAVVQGRRNGVGDNAIRDILDEVLRHVVPGVDESVRTALQALVESD